MIKMYNKNKYQFENIEALVIIGFILFISSISIVIAVALYQNLAPTFNSAIPESAIFMTYLENFLRFADYLTPFMFVLSSIFIIYSASQINSNRVLFGVGMLIAGGLLILGVAYPSQEAYNMMGTNNTMMTTALKQLPITNNFMTSYPIYIMVVLGLSGLALYGGYKFG